MRFRNRGLRIRKWRDRAKDCRLGSTRDTSPIPQEIPMENSGQLDGRALIYVTIAMVTW